MIALEHRPTVTAVRCAEEESAIAPLVLAFARDPALRWIYPDAHQFRLFFPRFTRALGEKAFALGTALRVKEFRGTALWLAPGVAPDRGALAPLIQGTVTPGRCAEVLALLDQMEAQRPAEPHWYLPLLGIDPLHQGKGLGSMLLGSTLTTIDGSGASAYVVASHPRNRAFYERHGFELRGEIQAGTSPSLFALIRPPR